MRNQKFNTTARLSQRHYNIHHTCYSSDMIGHLKKHSHIELHDTDRQNMLSTECTCIKGCH